MYYRTLLAVACATLVTSMSWAQTQTEGQSPVQTPTQSQNNYPSSIKEIGVQLNNLSDWGVVYRMGTERALWRFSAFGFGLDWHQTNDLMQVDDRGQSFQISAAVGHEWRKPIAEGFEFRYGTELGLGYAHDKTVMVDPNALTEGIQYPTTELRRGTVSLAAVLGINYVLYDEWVFGAELNPSLSYNFGRTEYVNQLGFTTALVMEDTWSIQANAAQALRLTAAYRF